MSRIVKLNDGKRLLNAGYSIMVVDEDKKPMLSWKALQETPWTEKELEEQIKRPNVWRYGLITGFGGLFCIDIDLKVFEDVDDREPFFEEFISFVRDNIDSFDKKVAIYKTANFGYHLVYRVDTDLGNVKLARRKGHAQAVLETRGVGGYIVVYDECTNGLDYTSVQKLTGEEHEIILGICRFFDDNQSEVVPDEPKQPEPTLQQPKGVSPWQEYNNRHEVMDVVGDEFKIVRNISSRYIIKRHGATSSHSGYIYKDTGCMYLFTTGTQYPSEKLLTPFALYTYRYHGGDYKAAARKLYEDGWGDRIVKKVGRIEQPITVDAESLEFPIDIFPQGIQHYILECHNTLGNSVDYMGVSMVWQLAVIVGNSCKVKVKAGWLEPACVWISAVGKAGIGKTPSVKNIVRPLSQINSREIKDYHRKYAKWKAYDSLHEKDKKTAVEVQEPKKTQFIVNDTTLEALIELHEENPNAVGVFKDELAGWIKDMNKYRQGGDLEQWLSSWSNEPIILNRKTVKNNYIDSPIIPVLGGIQPAILSDLFTAEKKDNGFIDRMLICFPDLEVDYYTEDELDEELLKWYSDYVRNMYSDIKNHIVRFDEDGEILPRTIKLSTDARKEWIRIFDTITDRQNSDAENEYMKSMLPKQKSYVPRFALLLNALEKYDEGKPMAGEISKSAMLKAERLSNYFIAMAKKLKLNITEVNKLKNIAASKAKSDEFEKFHAMLVLNPELNKSEAAEILNVSRQQLNRWEKEIRRAKS